MKFIKKLNNFSIQQSILFWMVLIIVLSTITVTLGNFLNFTTSTNDLVENTSKEINKQIILNYENYIDSVITTANYISGITTEYGVQSRNSELNGIYTQATELQNDIDSIILLNLSGDKIAGSNYQIIAEDVEDKSWFMDAILDTSVFHFSSPHEQDIYNDSSKDVITITKVIDYYNEDGKQSGVLVIDLLIDKIVELSNTTNLGENGHLIILNDDNSLIYSSSDSCTTSDCESVLLVEELIIGGEHVSVEGTNMYLNVNTLSDTRWRIAIFINTEVLSTTRNYTIVLSLLILAITFVIALFVSSTIAKRISSPLSKLMRHMNKIQKGNLYRKIELEGQKEVIELADKFNEMIEEIRDLYDTLVLEQKDKRKTEFIALQTQINPHFLYNTLDSIIYLSEHNQNEKVIQTVSALSKFFRISISRGKNIILLKEELEHARNYLLIQQIRYHEKFSFRFEVDEKTLEYKVVKLTLQPLIENALSHGINTEFVEGTIIIRSYVAKGKLYLEVEDNGYGIPEDKINEIYDSIKIEQKSKSVGLRNVYQRLKLYYGDESDMVIVSELDEKTIFRLVVPIERAK